MEWRVKVFACLAHKCGLCLDLDEARQYLYERGLSKFTSSCGHRQKSVGCFLYFVQYDRRFQGGISLGTLLVYYVHDRVLLATEANQKFYSLSRLCNRPSFYFILVINKARADKKVQGETDVFSRNFFNRLREVRTQWRKSHGIDELTAWWWGDAVPCVYILSVGLGE